MFLFCTNCRLPPFQFPRAPEDWTCSCGSLDVWAGPEGVFVWVKSGTGCEIRVAFGDKGGPEPRLSFYGAENGECTVESPEDALALLTAASVIGS